MGCGKRSPLQCPMARNPRRGVGTDANPMQLSRGGMEPVCFPSRRVTWHTPNELLSLEDLENSADPDPFPLTNVRRMFCLPLLT